MIFNSIVPHTEVTDWLCMEQLTTPELVLVCFNTSNTVELQERLNALCSRKDLWFPEFLTFLGIDDERVCLVAANDHAAALEANQREFNDV